MRFIPARVLGRLLPAALAVALAAPASAQFVSDLEAPAPVPTASPGSEGIKVHGKWTITVSNPDGSAAGRYEFQNALTQEGSQFLASILSGSLDSGSLEYRINLFTDDTGFGGGVATASAGSSGSVLVLSYSGSVAGGGSDWETQLVQTKAADEDGQGTSFTFTQKELETPIPIPPGGQVDVTVEISFE